MLLAAVACGAVALESRLHPLYTDGHAITRHSFWHEAYYGLQHNDAWLRTFGPEHQIEGRQALGDEQPVAGVLRYLRNHPEISRAEAFDSSGSLRWGAIDRILKLAFWEFAFEHPGFVIHTILVSKWAIFKAQFSSAWGILLTSLSPLRLLLFVGVVLWAGYILLTMGAVRSGRYRAALACAGLCFPVTVLPNFLTTVSWQTMADAILFALVIAFASISWALAYVARCVFRLGHGRTREPVWGEPIASA
jgi:hypothetical protein